MASGFEDRQEAGRALASAFGESGRERARAEDAIVLAMPRGGVPVGYEVAQSLALPLDILIVRKLGAPGQPELAMGAIASNDVRVMNRSVVEALEVDERRIEATAARETRELERREQAYRGSQPRPRLAGRCVILVDDGVATGASIRAAIAALRESGAARIVVAVPVGAADTVRQLEAEADEVVCPQRPEPFFAIGQHYRDFHQTTDAEVRELLQAAWSGSPSEPA